MWIAGFSIVPFEITNDDRRHVSPYRASAQVKVTDRARPAIGHIHDSNRLACGASFRIYGQSRMNAPLPATEGARPRHAGAATTFSTRCPSPPRRLTALAHTSAHAARDQHFVDQDRHGFKSQDWTRRTRDPTYVAFCAHRFCNRLVRVRTALTDERFADNPRVPAPVHSFYAGAPLNPPTPALGPLCVIDRTPRELHPTQADSLLALSPPVVAQLEWGGSTAARGIGRTQNWPRSSHTLKELR